MCPLLEGRGLTKLEGISATGKWQCEGEMIDAMMLQQLCLLNKTKKCGCQE
jgi:hypothetical protein